MELRLEFCQRVKKGNIKPPRFSQSPSGYKKRIERNGRHVAAHLRVILYPHVQ